MMEADLSIANSQFRLSAQFADEPPIRRAIIDSDLEDIDSDLEDAARTFFEGVSEHQHWKHFFERSQLFAERVRKSRFGRN
ncbi:hypothetical protein [Mesorhizobium sp. M0910]|uniref:hypothetical protein n=1 Tax=Mesorhizobium sp. M0910 TaxID=2957025 RepID=UPI00333DA14F